MNPGNRERMRKRISGGKDGNATRVKEGKLRIAEEELRKDAKGEKRRIFTRQKEKVVKEYNKVGR